MTPVWHLSWNWCNTAEEFVEQMVSVSCIYCILLLHILHTLPLIYFFLLYFLSRLLPILLTLLQYLSYNASPILPLLRCLSRLVAILHTRLSSLLLLTDEQEQGRLEPATCYPAILLPSLDMLTFREFYPNPIIAVS